VTLRSHEFAERIGEFWGYPQSRAFAELLIDCEEDRTLGRCSSGCWTSSTSSERDEARFYGAQRDGGPHNASYATRRHSNIAD
jgi:hypothetical protein